MRATIITYLFLCTVYISQAMEIKLTHIRPSEATLMCYQGALLDDLALVKKSLKQGADVNYIDEHGNSLLCTACWNADKKIIKKLLKHKNINVPFGSQQNEISPIYVIYDRNLLNLDIIKLIIKKNPQATYTYSHNATLLHYATAQEYIDYEGIKYLLTYDKTVVNNQDIDGNTPLHLVYPNDSLSKKHLKTIKLLIKHGADTTITNTLHITPLLYIFGSSKNSGIFAQFIKKNPKIAQQLIRSVDIDNNSQLHLCTRLPILEQKKFQQYLSFLISHGVDPQLRNNDHKRAVDLACEAYERFHKEYMMEKDLTIKEIFETQYSLILSKRIMHCFLCATSPYIKCAAFKEILQKKDLSDIYLPIDIQRCIAYFYYALNIETIIANKYIEDDSYYKNFIEDENTRKQQLFEKPEPHLLWNR